jgi:dTDP-4-amino-4,6-dideoxygalactose transaminase
LRDRQRNTSCWCNTGLADVDPLTMNIDPIEIERRITDRTRAILPVHFAGRPCDMDAIMDIAARHKLKVIEDCAHAIETEYKGQKIGTLAILLASVFTLPRTLLR